jgi:hypothetical protein
MNRFGTALALGLFAVCANAGTINVTPSNMNGWSAENDEANTNSGFVFGPTGQPLGVGSFWGSVQGPADSAGGVVLATGAYSSVLLSDVTGLSFSTYETSNTNGQSFDIVLYLTNANQTVSDSLFFEPRYQGDSDTVALNTWQNWSSTASTAGWYAESSGNYGNGVIAPPLESITAFEDANPGMYLTAVGVQAGYLDPVWQNFNGNVDAFGITTDTGINDLYNFDPDVATPEPSTWLSLGGGLLLVGFAMRRKFSANAA